MLRELEVEQGLTAKRVAMRLIFASSKISKRTGRCGNLGGPSSSVRPVQRRYWSRICVQDPPLSSPDLGSCSGSCPAIAMPEGAAGGVSRPAVLSRQIGRDGMAALRSRLSREWS